MHGLTVPAIAQKRFRPYQDIDFSPLKELCHDAYLADSPDMHYMIFTDKQSGRNFGRPGYKKLVRQIRKREMVQNSAAFTMDNKDPKTLRQAAGASCNRPAERYNERALYSEWSETAAGGEK